jgi:hypothetical protein
MDTRQEGPTKGGLGRQSLSDYEAQACSRYCQEYQIATSFPATLTSARLHPPTREERME